MVSTERLVSRGVFNVSGHNICYTESLIAGKVARGGWGGGYSGTGE